MTTHVTLSDMMTDPAVKVPDIGRALAQELGSWDDGAAMALFAKTVAGTPLEARLANTAPEILLAVLRAGAGLPVGENSARITGWIAQNKARWSKLLSPDAREWPAITVEVGGAQSEIALASAQQDREKAQTLYDTLMSDAEATLAIGPWMEHRIVYSTDAYISALIPGVRRDFHLGYDLFAPALTPLYMPMAGRIVDAGIIDQRLDYGGYIVTAHDIGDGVEFYALWGHLAHESPRRWNVGDVVAEGTELALMGDFEENGWWLPHLHLQLSTLPFTDFAGMPGVGEEALQDLWKEIFPDPHPLVMGA